MEAIPFSIDSYKTHVLLTGEYHVETRNGTPARVIATDVKNNVGRSVIALVDAQLEGESTMHYANDGSIGFDARPGAYDLVIVKNKPKSLGWAIVWKNKRNGHLHSDIINSQEVAKARIDFINKEGFYEAISLTEVFQNL